VVAKMKSPSDEILCHWGEMKKKEGTIRKKVERLDSCRSAGLSSEMLGEGEMKNPGRAEACWDCTEMSPFSARRCKKGKKTPGQTSHHLQRRMHVSITRRGCLNKENSHNGKGGKKERS